MKHIFIRFSSLTAIFMFSVAMLVPAAASAAIPANCGKGFLGFPHWYEYLVVTDDCQVVGPCVNAENGTAIPDNDCATTPNSVTRLSVGAAATRVSLAIIDILLRVGGLVAFGFIVYAGFQFVLSSGDTAKEVAARSTIINAVIGMLIVIFAVAIVTFAGRSLSQ